MLDLINYQLQVMNIMYFLQDKQTTTAQLDELNKRLSDVSLEKIENQNKGEKYENDDTFNGKV